jgi:hypothetical protein
MDMSTESVVTTTLIETTTEKPTSDLHTTTDSVVMPTLTETTTMKPTTDLDTTDSVVSGLDIKDRLYLLVSLVTTVISIFNS